MTGLLAQLWLLREMAVTKFASLFCGPKVKRFVVFCKFTFQDALLL